MTEKHGQVDDAASVNNSELHLLLRRNQRKLEVEWTHCLSSRARAASEGSAFPPLFVTLLAHSYRPSPLFVITSSRSERGICISAFVCHTPRALLPTQPIVCHHELAQRARDLHLPLFVTLLAHSYRPSPLLSSRARVASEGSVFPPLFVITSGALLPTQPIVVITSSRSERGICIPAFVCHTPRALLPAQPIVCHHELAQRARDLHSRLCLSHASRTLTDPAHCLSPQARAASEGSAFPPLFVTRLAHSYQPSPLLSSRTRAASEGSAFPPLFLTRLAHSYQPSPLLSSRARAASEGSAFPPSTASSPADFAPAHRTHSAASDSSRPP